MYVLKFDENNNSPMKQHNLSVRQIIFYECGRPYGEVWNSSR